MSAYIVDKATIDAIVTFAYEGGQSITVRKLVGPGWASLRDIDKSTVGRALWRENIKSVDYRYDENNDDPDLDYTFKAVRSRVHREERGGTGVLVKISPADIVRIIQCLEYQSCEHPDWEASWAKDTLQRIKDAAVDKLIPDSAPWGLKDSEVA
jgi:hypothetical protein